MNLEELGERRIRPKRNSFDWSSGEDEDGDGDDEGKKGSACGEDCEGSEAGSELGLGKYFGKSGVGIRWW